MVYILTDFCIDDLPVSGTVGRDPNEGKEEIENDPHLKPLYVYTHKSFTIDYNRNQVTFLYLFYKSFT